MSRPRCHPLSRPGITTPWTRSRPSTLTVAFPFSTTTAAGRNPPLPIFLQNKPYRSLAGKVAIVTGAGTPGGPNEVGNGRATALLLAEDGASVVCVDRDLQSAERTVSMIEELLSFSSPTNTTIYEKADPPSTSTTKPLKEQKLEKRKRARAIAIQADVTSSLDCKGIISTALASFGRLDILVNVVGMIGARGTAVEVDPGEWDEGMEVNVKSVMLMAKYAVPAMRRNGFVGMCGDDVRREGDGGSVAAGSIVNIASVAGLRGGTPHLLYPASKGAVVNMSRAMAAHHGRDGVRVNCVCPGEFVTVFRFLSLLCSPHRYQG
jgi:NAD(P)-dependent dehydrogenase (short-subunit alcohol dehydrogenase family)